MVVGKRNISLYNETALKSWKGEAANVGAAQKIFYHRAKMNSAARSGKYTKQMESPAS